jgi:colanic acid biosynthesis glycosyl transferase WcaI
MPVRVLLITQWFDPEPTPKGLAFARELARQGFSVEVLTGFPNYPTGRLYPGYRMRWRERRLMDGVVVHRVPLYPSHDQSALRRAFNYLSFAFSVLIHGLAAAGRADVIYVYHPPLTVAAAGTLLALLRRRPVVCDIQDLWPDTLAATGMVQNQSVLRVVSVLCDWVYRHVDRIAVLSPGFKRMLLARGVPAGKVEVIYNWSDETALRSAEAAPPVGFPGAERFRIVFAGNLGRAQGLDAVLGAAALLQQRGSPVTFVFVGDGVERARLLELAEAQKLTNVTFLPAVPMNEIGAVLSAADALLVHLRRDPLFEITIPSKIQAYMTVGKPVLAAVAGDAAELVQRAKCGVVAVPGDSRSIAEGAASLASHSATALEELGRTARRFYSEELSLAKGASAFGSIFRQLASEKQAA